MNTTTTKQKEIEEWEYNKKFSIKPVAIVTDKERLKSIQLAKEKYDKEKLELQLWNLATTIFCFSLTLSFYPIVIKNLTMEVTYI